VTLSDASTWTSSPLGISRHASSSICSLATMTTGRSRAEVLCTRSCGAATAGGSLEHEQRVDVWVAQRPQFRGGNQHEVDRLDREVLHDPEDGRANAHADIAPVTFDLGGNQREIALRVSLAQHQRPGVSEMGFQRGDVANLAVVGKQPVVLAERMCVYDRQTAGGGVTNVGDEGARSDLSRCRCEPTVVERGDRLFIDVRAALRIEIAHTGPVNVAMTLVDKAVGRVEQPEGSPHRL
jgi:hypothetical protein